MSWTTVETRLGQFTLVARDGAIVRIQLPGSQSLDLDGLPEARGRDPRDLAALQQASHELREYGDGRRAELTFPIRPEGTPFQQEVWRALRGIPYGETRSYADIAAAIGRPGAARAVGQANRKNPLPLIVPCHRVVAADGTLGGYMGQWSSEGEGGVRLKRSLLELEGATRPSVD
jgi:methylated-DNA-[protein]-cysteine S-methyltransferase